MKHHNYSTLLYLVVYFTCIISCQNKTENSKISSIDTDIMKMEKLIIGTYTGDGDQSAKGIYLVNRDIESGSLEMDSLWIELDNPNFQAISPDGQILYSVSETSEEGGSVMAFKILNNGQLELLNKQPSLGISACHVAVNHEQTMVFVANYSSGVSSVFQIMKDGSLSEPVQHFKYEGSGPHPNQKSPHPHQTAISPDDKYAYICDLGMDAIHQYRMDKEMKNLIPLEQEKFILPRGSGPRHMTFHPGKPFAYVINELGNTIQAMNYDSDNGHLSEIEIYSTLPDDFSGESYCADIHISPDGQFLYGSNRGHNSLVIFRINESNGHLERVGFNSVHGDWPRNFYISPDGKFIYVANQRSGNISSFHRDLESGLLSLIDSSFLGTYSPVSIMRWKE